MQDYVSGLPAATRFFPIPFGVEDSLPQAKRAIDERFGPEERATVARILGPGVREDPRRAARLDAFVKEGGYVVTTGQQPGLLSGPLYTVYKALTAVEVARRYEAELGRPVLPVFWVASEDHDWAESESAAVLDVENRVVRLTCEAQEPPLERPLFRVALTGPAHLIERMENVLPPSDFRADVLARVSRAYPEGTSLPAGFEEFLEGLLGDEGLFLVQAHNPELKQASLPVLRKEIECAEVHERRLTERAEQLEAAGYEVQVSVLEGGVNLFVEGSGGRERLYRDEGAFHLRHSGERFTGPELLARLESDPSGVSPNVLLRPVVENHVFPSLAYVAGPGEMAYYGEIGVLFDAHDVAPPIVHPRAAITLVETKVRKVLAKFGLEISDLARPAQELAGEMAQDEMPAAARQALGELRGAVGRESASLLDAVQAVDPTLKGPISNARNTAFAAFQEAEKKILQSLKRANAVSLEQIEKARANLFPEGVPQERGLNVVHFLARYGPSLIPHMRARIAELLAGET